MKTQILLQIRINYLVRQKLLSLNPAIKELNTSEFNFLMYLYRTKDFELSLKELEFELQQSQSGLNDISFRLEKLGYIQRFKDPDDKRRLKAKLTETGLQYVAERDDESFADEQILLQGISQEEKDVFIKVSETIYENAQKLLKERLHLE